MHTAQFPNGIEADIKLVICEEEAPYTEGVLFHNGFEIAHTDCEDEYAGDWYFEANRKEYCVHVVEDPTMNLDDIDSELEEISY